MAIPPVSFRVVMVGDSEVGKTSIIHSFIRGSFEANSKTTVGAVFHTFTREYEGQKIIIQVWDTAGQEKYRSIGPIYYRNASVAIAVFDVRVDDFEASLDSWIVNVKRSALDPLIFVVGNKCDLIEDDAFVMQRMRAFAERHSAECVLTSAKSGKNIAELFERVVAAFVRSCRADQDVFVTDAEGAEVKRECCSGPIAIQSSDAATACAESAQVPGNA
jgi:small GTP-binding protein